MLQPILRRHNRGEGEEEKWTSTKEEKGEINGSRKAVAGKILLLMILGLLIGLLVVSKTREGRALALALHDRDQQLTIYRILLDVRHLSLSCYLYSTLVLTFSLSLSLFLPTTSSPLTLFLTPSLPPLSVSETLPLTLCPPLSLPSLSLSRYLPQSISISVCYTVKPIKIRVYITHDIVFLSMYRSIYLSVQQSISLYLSSLHCFLYRERKTASWIRKRNWMNKRRRHYPAEARS